MSSKSKVPLALAVLVAVLAFAVGPGRGQFLQLVGGAGRLVRLLDSSSAPVLGDDVVDIDGMEFPKLIKVAGTWQQVIGGGTRSKWGVRVYALGIYSDPRFIKRLKKTHPDQSITDSKSKAAEFFYNAKRARTLLLRFHRGVASKDVSEALGEALTDKIGEEKSNVFSKFILDMMGKDRLEKGSDIFITCNGEKLWASLTGDQRDAKVIKSIKGLCPAVFMAYLGSSPVSEHIKQGFEKGYGDLEV